MSLYNLHAENSRALTFKIGESLFGIDVGYILSFSDSFEEIKYATHDAGGFVGYLDFRNTLVKVFDCATSLSQERERDVVNGLIESIKTYRQAHIDWVNALEHSIMTDEPFTKPRNPKMCAFGQWFYSFETEDDALRALLDKIEQPHNHIHSLADTLLDMVASGQRDQAIDLLRLEKQTTLKKLLRTLQYITELLSSGIHPIVLHLTKDGRTPWFSLVLDDIGDIVDYSPATIDKVDVMDSSEPIEGYVRDPSGTNFMILSLNKFYEQVIGKVEIAG
ncbi:CZB domain-containing protein [Neptuniibacter sp.]|uniref:CZB domain-containing protein n=1 Tax=Neptuniibacter sp. TaxID=1962643 RepID=UPI003B5D02A5